MAPFCRWIAWIALALPCAANAAELPQWEAGIGISVLSIPDYRGSDQGRTYVLPIPYVVYRGDVLKVDRRSVRGVFYKSDRVEVDTSFSGSPPARSGRNGARKGMPDLDPTLEAGPSLKIRLDENRATGYRADLQLPLRAVFMSDFSYLKYVGIVFNPRLNFDWARVGSEDRWSAGFAIGPVFVDTKNAGHYYSVDPVYATPIRSEYAAHGGYAGIQLAAAATRRYKSIWLGAFARADGLHGARFEDSPLVKTKYSFTAGLAVSWVFSASKIMVEAEE
jgi:outer membrane scaffolding protein for murein synthesis (MipA/OmpV family)